MTLNDKGLVMWDQLFSKVLISLFPLFRFLLGCLILDDPKQDLLILGNDIGAFHCASMLCAINVTQYIGSEDDRTEERTIENNAMKTNARKTIHGRQLQGDTTEKTTQGSRYKEDNYEEDNTWKTIARRIIQERKYKEDNTRKTIQGRQLRGR